MRKEARLEQIRNSVEKFIELKKSTFLYRLCPLNGNYWSFLDYLGPDHFQISYQPISVASTLLLTLSKHMQSTDPDTFITREFIQKIFLFFNLCIANSLPTVMAAGRAGGITIVIISKAFTAMSAGWTFRDS